MELPVPELRLCPFCGGHARISHREVKFLGQNDFGIKLIRTAAYGMCNICKCKGYHVFVDIHVFGPNYAEELNSLILKAAEMWNKRAMLT